MPTTLEEAADAFYAAGNRLLAGDPSAFSEIWSDADDISHLGPTGALCTGRQAVMEEFAKESAMGFAEPWWPMTAATWKWPGHWRAVHHHTDRF